jgi:hypothetical protein
MSGRRIWRESKPSQRGRRGCPSSDKGWQNRVILGVSNPITLQGEMSCPPLTEESAVQLEPAPQKLRFTVSLP